MVVNQTNSAGSRPIKKKKILINQWCGYGSLASLNPDPGKENQGNSSTETGTKRPEEQTEGKQECSPDES